MRYWTRDELILALDAYFDIAPSAPDPKIPALVELSSLLRAMHPGDPPSGYRTPASVVMKLMNFRSLDPNYDGEGLKSVSRADRDVWATLAGDRARVKLLAQGICGAISAGYRLDNADEPLVAEAPEGRLLTRVHVARERNAALVASKKAERLRETGALYCEACGFDFAATYGPRGAGFIECHHTKPLHLLKANEKTRLTDLALLCANCHRMVHARRPWLSLDELRACLHSVRSEPR